MVVPVTAVSWRGYDGSQARYIAVELPPGTSGCPIIIINNLSFLYFLPPYPSTSGCISDPCQKFFLRIRIRNVKWELSRQKKVEKVESRIRTLSSDPLYVLGTIHKIISTNKFSN